MKDKWYKDSSFIMVLIINIEIIAAFTMFLLFTSYSTVFVFLFISILLTGFLAGIFVGIFQRNKIIQDYKDEER